jgi:hypothetical protein
MEIHRMNAKNMMITLAAGTVLAFSSASFAAVKIKGNNDQSTTVNGAVANTAVGVGAKAKQNISSNKGNVSISGDNKQDTTVNGAIANTAVGVGARAEQNLSSNED